MIGSDVDSDTKAKSILTFLHVGTNVKVASFLHPFLAARGYSNCNYENAIVMFPTRAVSSLRIREVPR